MCVFGHDGLLKNVFEGKVLEKPARGMKN